MDQTNKRIERFFEGRPTAMLLFDGVKEAVEFIDPSVEMRFGEGSIKFGAQNSLAEAWFPNDEMTKRPYQTLGLTIFLDHEIADLRVFSRTNPRPGICANEMILNSLEDVDQDLRDWLKEAIDLSKRS